MSTPVKRACTVNTCVTILVLRTTDAQRDAKRHVDKSARMLDAQSFAQLPVLPVKNLALGTVPTTFVQCRAVRFVLAYLATNVAISYCAVVTDAHQCAEKTVLYKYVLCAPLNTSKKQLLMLLCIGNWERSTLNKKNLTRS